VNFSQIDWPFSASLMPSSPVASPRIFEPFFSTKQEKGSGLELWMARGIANKYSGTIRVRSSVSKRSSGTCVVVAMPSQQARRTQD